MQLLTQNEDLKKSGIYGWTLPAHWNTLSNGTKFNTCPNAGICAAFCYAKNGRWNFSNVKKAHIEKLELVLNEPDKFKQLMNEELSKKNTLINLSAYTMEEIFLIVSTLLIGLILQMQILNAHSILTQKKLVNSNILRN